MIREELLQDLIDNHGFKRCGYKNNTWHIPGFIREHSVLGYVSYLFVCRKAATAFLVESDLLHSWDLENPEGLKDFILQLESMDIYPGVKV
jgi:hypothetical protein